MKRRDFLKSTVGAATVAGLFPATATTRAAQVNSGSRRQHFEWRTYTFKPNQSHDLVTAYWRDAAIPALRRLGLPPIGVFEETAPAAQPRLFILLAYPELEMIDSVPAELARDAAYQQAAAPYLLPPKSKPAYDRMERWFMRAFSGMPTLELPPLSQAKKPRIFELRTYQSYCEAKAAKKIQMFNSGEIEIMHHVGLGPVFYGQKIFGPDLPNLTYMLSGENREEHAKNWKAFFAHPVWKRLQADPQFANTVSHVGNFFLKPTDCSQI